MKLLVEGSVTPLDTSSKAVEVNEVLHNVFVITHMEILEFGSCFALRVIWAKVILQFHSEVRVVIEPGWVIARSQ